MIFYTSSFRSKNPICNENSNGSTKRKILFLLS